MTTPHRFIQLDLQAPVHPTEVVDPVDQIAHRLTDVGKPRKREASADLVWIHALGRPVVPFHCRGVGGVIAESGQFLIDAPLGASGTFDVEIHWSEPNDSGPVVKHF